MIIFIACLGFLGIVSFTSKQRTKEIGIRKILGASTSSLVVLVLKEFIKWIAVSNLAAWPLAYFIITRWLNNYAYHVPVSADIFIFASAIALIMAFSTVSLQSLKAGLANPADSLRYE